MLTPTEATVQAPVGFLAGGAPEEIRLSECAVTADIGCRIALVTHAQTFRNVTPDVREVTYAFPRPASGQVIRLSARLGDSVTELRPARTRDAEIVYEHERNKGNLPVLLKDGDEDVICLHLGKLAPEESAEVEMRFAIPLRLRGRSGELRIPTVIAPRYGANIDPERAAAMPDPDLTVEHPLRLKVALWGAMREAQLVSGSHSLVPCEDGGERRVFVLDEAAHKDRDIVLRLDGITETRAGMLSQNPFDGGHVAWVDILDCGVEPHPRRNLHFLVDCSGSMSGLGERIARGIVEECAKMIRTDDTVGMSRFDNVRDHVLRPTEGEDARKLFAAKASLLRANRCGGTELGRALRETVDGVPKAADIVLLTDGLIHEGNDLVDTMRGCGHRVFAIGIGSSPRGSLLEALAEATDGTASFASTPGDASSIAGRIDRFTSSRLRQVTDVKWAGVTPEWQMPLPQTIFPEVPLPIVARLAAGQEPPREALVTIGDDEPFTVPLSTVTGREAELAKLAAQREHLDLTDLAKRERLALAYGLATEDVTFVGSVTRAGELHDEGIPTVVRPMMAAGYGGFGTVDKTGGEVLFQDASMDGDPLAGVVGPDGEGLFSLLDPSGNMGIPRAFHEDNLLALNSPAGIFREKSAKSWEPVLAPSPTSMAGYPARCPARFLRASDWNAARASMSKFLANVCKILVARQWSEAEVTGTLAEVVRTKLAAHGTAPGSAPGTARTEPLTSLFMVLVSDRLREDRWRQNTEALFDASSIVERAKAGPGGIARREGLTGAEISGLSGLPQRLVRTYAEIGVIERPSGTNGSSLYNGRHLADLQVAKRLAEEGHTPGEIAEIMRRRREASGHA